MYKNIGVKIKSLAATLAVIGIILSWLAALITVFAASGDCGAIVIAILEGIVGSLVSWMSSFFMYGFGQLIDNTDILVERFSPPKEEVDNKKKDEQPMFTNPVLTAKLDGLKVLLSSGKIDQATYEREVRTVLEQTKWHDK